MAPPPCPYIYGNSQNGGPGPHPPGGQKKCTFRWVLNNSPSRDKIRTFFALFRTPGFDPRQGVPGGHFRRSPHTLPEGGQNRHFRRFWQFWAIHGSHRETGRNCHFGHFSGFVSLIADARVGWRIACDPDPTNEASDPRGKPGGAQHWHRCDEYARSDVLAHRWQCVDASWVPSPPEPTCCRRQLFSSGLRAAQRAPQVELIGGLSLARRRAPTACQPASQPASRRQPTQPCDH